MSKINFTESMTQFAGECSQGIQQKIEQQTKKPTYIKKCIGFISTGANTTKVVKCAVQIDTASHILSIYNPSYRCLDLESVLSFLTSDKDIKEELLYMTKFYKRKYPMRVKIRKGLSGCRDVSLIYCKGPEWACGLAEKVAFKIHITMAGKIRPDEMPEDIFMGDLLEILANVYGRENIIEYLFNDTIIKTESTYTEYPFYENVVEYDTPLCGYAYDEDDEDIIIVED